MEPPAHATFLGDLSEKSFKIAWWPEGTFVQPAKTGTVTWEQLVAMLFFHLMSFNLSHCRTVYCFLN